MKIIFAQGNPGREYESNRHNVGFYMLDCLARSYETEFLLKPKFFSSIAEATFYGQKILLVKPQTYYNETGKAARALIDFYKLTPATDFLVIYDELALPFGVIRTRLQGSDAGNNGIKSLNAHIGDLHARIRVGIDNDLRSHMQRNADFVLSSFSQNERESLPKLYEQVKRFADGFIQNSFEITKVTTTQP